MKQAIWAVVLLSGVLGAAPAAAQYMPSFSNSMLLLDVYTYTYNTKPTGRSAPSKPATTPVAPASTRYTPSAAVSARVQKRFVAFIGEQTGPEGAREMETVLATQDATGSWLGVVGRDGLVANDLVDAIAAYWVLNWNIANQTDSNRAQMLGAREQVRRAVTSNPQIMALGNEGRQEMAEALVLNFLVQHAAFRDAVQAGDKTMMGKYGDAAVARFRNEAKIDLRAMKLTAAGFQKI